ncbi:MAG TPA: MFS transporter [Thermomicrobiales bacterium]|nr:MFS transporter [Thermomicrobiales bacterium]
MAATTNAQVFALLLSPMAQDFGISVARLAGLRTIEEVVAIVTGIALAPFIDRTTRKRLLLSGLALMAAAAAIAVAATSPWHLVGYFAVDGISKILLFSTLLAMPGDLASGRRLDRALGFVIGSFALSGFTIVPLVGYIAARFSWREGYVVAVVTALISFLFVLAVIPAIRPGDRPPASPLRHLGLIVRFPGLATALTGALLRFMMFSSVLTFSGAFLINEHQVSVSRAGVYFSLGAASFLIASILSGFLLQFVGTTRALVHGGMLAATCVLVAFASGVPLSLAGCALLVTVALMGIHENASTGLLLRLSRGQRGAAMSLNELCAAAGALLGIGFGAVALRQFGYGGIGALLGLVGVLAAAVTMRAIRSGDSVDRPETSGGLTVTAPRT